MTGYSGNPSLQAQNDTLARGFARCCTQRSLQQAVETSQLTAQDEHATR